MSVCVRFPALFADRIGGISTVQVTATTVEGAVRALSEHHPQLKPLVLGPGGGINPLMVVFLNDEQLSTDQLQTAVRAGDEIEILPAVEGGSDPDAGVLRGSPCTSRIRHTTQRLLDR